MKAAVITVSDRVTRGEAEDESGPAAAAALEEIGFQVSEQRVVPDGVESVRDALRMLIDEVSLIVTTGGTGFSPRDLTPEATTLVVQRRAPGIAEAMRSAASAENPYAMLSRGVAGIASRTLIINLPGSVRAVKESLAVIGPALKHGVELVIATQSDHNAEDS
jgi:molybdenum cofactor synthesis domain-containing protein